MSNQKYATEFKRKVVEFYLDRHTVKETLHEFSVHESTLFVWKKQYQGGTLDRPHRSKADSIHHMQRHLDQMKAVLEAQSILRCSPDTSNADKVKAVDALKGRYLIGILCDAVNLPKGTYYIEKGEKNIQRNTKEMTN